MLISRWVVTFAFGLVFILSVEAWGQSTTENDPKNQPSTTTGNGTTNAQQADTETIIPSLDGIEAAIRDLIAQEDQVDQEAQDRRASRDLKAQEDMAWWAKLMFFATAATVLLTYLALRAIVKTLEQTKRAADYTGDMLKEAEKATKAAMDGVLVTRDIGEKQVRAYLHVTGIEFTLGEKEGEVGVSLSIANAGQSPAVSAKGVVVLVGHGKEPITLNVPLPNIPANSDPTRTIRPMKPKGSTSCLKGATRIAVYVTVTAQDVFGEEIKAVSMRTIGIPSGAKFGQTYQPEDADGFFPDKAVELLAANYGGLGPNQNNTGPEG